jgi:hypothetical protein
MRLKYAGFACLVALGFGCVDVSGKGEVLGWLSLDECSADSRLSALCDDTVSDVECSAFNLGADFFALELFDEQSGKLRLQRGGASFIKTDALVLDIRDIRSLRGRLGTPIAIGEEQDVRAALILGSTCPSSTQSLALSGELVIHQFGIEVGDRIFGEISFLEVRDGREPLVGLIGVLRGHFDFVFQNGTPFEQFYR